MTLPLKAKFLKLQRHSQNVEASLHFKKLYYDIITVQQYILKLFSMTQSYMKFHNLLGEPAGAGFFIYFYKPPFA